MDRRSFFYGAGVAGFAAGASTLSSAPAHAMSGNSVSGYQLQESSIVGDLFDLTKPQDNVEAYARVVGNTDMKSTKFGWGEGIVQGVRPGEGLRDLVGFLLISTAKYVPYQGPELPAGMKGYSKVLREIGLYTDLETGEVLEEWVNPYLNEKQPVVPIANDPFNHHITPFKPKGPAYGGLRDVSDETREPYILNWSRKGDLVQLFRNINLFYPNALQPDKWPRESSGEFNRVTETFIHTMSWADLQNPNLTSVEHHGTWSRTTPWLPWMLMGPTPGHCQYHVMMGGQDSMERANPKALDYVAAKYPKYLDVPQTWEEPSLSSLEWYSRERTPAPVPAGGPIPTAPETKLPAWWDAAKKRGG